MDRQEYPTMAATLEPGQAISVLNDRVRQVGRLNSDIADWLQERRRLEEQYSAGLRKLARRSPPGDSIQDLGIFSVPWTTLTSALETLAESHQVLAQRIEVDVERPLRDFGSNSREMQAMSTIQGNLTSMARDVENAQKKSERLNNKGSNNAGRADSELEGAQSQWSAQAPYVFESLQSLDESRLNHLRDVLTQFQTHEIDAIEKTRVSAESVLNILLNIETADEIKTYALRVASGDIVPKEKPRSRQSMFIPPSLAPSTQHDDSASVRSGPAPVDQLPESKGKQKGGLKRLGTLLGRNKNRDSKIIPNRASESPERKPSRPSAFNSLSSRFGRNNDLPTPLEENEEHTNSPLRTITSNTNSSYRGPSNGDKELPPIDGSAQSLAAAGLAPEPSYQPYQQNTAPQLQEPLQPSQASLPLQPSPQPFAPDLSQPFQPLQSSQTLQPTRDIEGFSEPPPAVDLISQAQQEAADANDANQPQFKLDIRNAPIAEEGGDAALTSVVNTLKMQAPPLTSRRAGTVRGRRDMRASVYGQSPVTTPDVTEEASAPSIAPPPIQTTQEMTRAPLEISTSSLSSAQSPSSPMFTSASSNFPSSTFSPFHGSAQATAASVFARPASRIGESDHDTGSIRSGRSLSSSQSQTSKHPELHEPGLNSSIIETVSAWFEQGQLTRSVTIGEIALAYNPSNFTSPFGHENIRVDGFSSLEKVAPNPAFLTAADQSGEYSVNLAGIQKTAVAFKYQVSSPGTTAAPLLLTPAWKIEPTQTSAILSYSLNPAFILPAGQTSMTLQNVVLMLYLDPTSKASTCLSKPVGNFDKAKNLIYWQLGNITLSSTPGKLLARFQTPEGEARAGHIEAKWEVVGNGLGDSLGVSVREEAAKEADPFADESIGGGEGGGAWKRVAEIRRVVAGVYHAK
ncbi:hypothetical protein AUEXF2481DRAFT_29759 [Aureobasidium subglaciale EXF-2481]|uniref:MHD domain-containing protein n=1 Tax=Aureobasidium subglaciale (strain EXF-2481) TaxID=1043005 RepID=A0A074YLP8_AURSE|nr:uncharacterized protein AUEXF2481DRAFT_29759 [Aureobasidium subglaciale EXF-2481]KAI5211707.1 hypothetical protein E4T38_01193 [Aureobasidium subglaciale]KAI5230402.1 hypothetical protein E4T40_01194 [Aureobasidium subglaciale]KAI5233530.1 hypothetical protein E4T41_01192 [Aureobasidium subglaciale]KAI5266892.1 hypothetical protein E4T46_01192 [Aureobasidium subglaciale]KEQ95032.1 hypothetical protein AUEXF2481DRAFT_29759 [Aureobasidium subglaciale EXF-2481]